MADKLYPFLLLLLLAGCTAEPLAPQEMEPIVLEPDPPIEPGVRKFDGVNRTVSFAEDQYVHFVIGPNEDNQTILHMELVVLKNQFLVLTSREGPVFLESEGPFSVTFSPGRTSMEFALWMQQPPDELTLRATSFLSLEVRDVSIQNDTAMTFIPAIQPSQEFQVPDRTLAMRFDGEETDMLLKFEPDDKSGPGGIYPSTRWMYAPNSEGWTMEIWRGVQPTHVTPHYYVWDPL